MTKPRTKLVPIGWVNRYDREFQPFGEKHDSKMNAEFFGSGVHNYIDTVRVFAEVPVKQTKKGSK